MRSLQDFREEYGWSQFPPWDALVAAVRRVDQLVQEAMGDIDLRGFRDRVTAAARKDLAGAALSRAEGYRRRVYSFRELPWAELAYVAAWAEQADLAQELARLGWLPEPAPQRILRLLREDDGLPPRTRGRLLARFVEGAPA